SDRMCLSSVRSATSRFSRAFSSSSWPQAAQLTHPQVGVLLFPGVEGRFAHAQLAAHIADRGAALRLAEGIRGNIAWKRGEYYDASSLPCTCHRSRHERADRSTSGMSLRSAPPK